MPQFRCRKCNREAIIPLAFCDDDLMSDQCEFDSDDRALTMCSA